MPIDPAAKTSESLLGRLYRHPDDPVAWDRFVERYRPLIFGWCRHWSLQEADAEDVTQDVLLRLAKKLRSFTYDPGKSFRGWLRTLTRNAWNDFLAERYRPDEASGSDLMHQALLSVAAREDLFARLEAEFDQEVLDEAMARVRERVIPHTWQAFCLLAIEGMSGEEVAAALKLPITAVFKAKSRVLQLIREEVAQLEKDDPPEPPTS